MHFDFSISGSAVATRWIPGASNQLTPIRKQRWQSEQAGRYHLALYAVDSSNNCWSQELVVEAGIQQTEINLSGLAPGIYYLSLSNELSSVQQFESFVYWPSHFAKASFHE